MSEPKIVNMTPLPAAVWQGLISATSGVKVEVTNLDENYTKETLADADIIVGDYTFNRPITAGMLEAAKRLKLIQQPSDGYNQIDIEAAAARGVPVANTAGCNDIAVAEHTVMVALALLKKTIYANARTHEGAWAQEEMLWNKGTAELYGKNYGIIGLGRIGKEVAKRLPAFGVKILYYDAFRPDEEQEKLLNVTYKPLEELLKTCDVVSIHVPLTEQTSGLIGSEELAKMKRSAVLINVSRGEIVDEEALAEALKKKKIAGAGIDVFAQEPISPDNPLLNTENVILTPHIAGTTQEARQRISTAAVENIGRVLKGEKPINIVNGVD